MVSFPTKDKCCFSSMMMMVMMMLAIEMNEWVVVERWLMTEMKFCKWLVGGERKRERERIKKSMLVVWTDNLQPDPLKFQRNRWAAMTDYISSRVWIRDGGGRPTSTTTTVAPLPSSPRLLPLPPLPSSSSFGAVGRSVTFPRKKKPTGWNLKKRVIIFEVEKKR